MLRALSTVFQPGNVIAERYRVTRVLGEGGMGVVAAAEHLLLGEPVALKVLLAEAAAQPEIVARFQREARAAARIQSEHVARVLDVGLLPSGEPFLVMEYLAGRDLGKELEERGPLPLTEAVDRVLEAAIGVASAHALGIVHRDLKPANLFLAELPNGRRLVKVLDFGIAKDTEPAGAVDLTRTTATFGSAPYMSPEQIRATRSVDVRTDVWSLGVVLFELLTNTWPFEGETVYAMAASITGDPSASLVARRRDVPAGLDAVVSRCLQKDREARFASVGGLARALAAFGGTRAPALAERVSEILAEDSSLEAASRSSVASAPPGDARSESTPVLTATREPWSRPAPADAEHAKSARLLVWIPLAAVSIGAVAWVAAREGAPSADAEPPRTSVGAASVPAVNASSPLDNAAPPEARTVPTVGAPAPTVPAAVPPPPNPPATTANRTASQRRSKPPRQPQSPSAVASAPTAVPAPTPPAAPAPRVGGALIKDL